MLTKRLLPLLTIMSALLLTGLTALAQSKEEAELATSSTITSIHLPAGAVRILPASVPAGISDALRKLVATGEGKVVQGDSEVLAWAGGNYEKANAENIFRQVQNDLQARGWTYAAGEKEGQVNVFSAVRENPKPRGVVGFYVPTDDAFVIAWTEILPANATTNNSDGGRVERPTAGGGNNLRALIGTWTNGNTSMLGERNTVTGVVTARNGSTYKYIFTANGRFEFVGLLQSTMYGCTTSLFNHKTGTVEINGSELTLVPDKNYWKNTYSCSPASNKERDYVLDRETYTWRTKVDEYGKTLICLANNKGESCYREAN